MSQYNTTDEITLRDIILKVVSYFSQLRIKYKWLLVAGFLMSIVMAIKPLKAPALYKEQLTFMMDETQGDAVQGLDLLGGLFGGKKQDNLGKILQLFESRKIIHNTLFDTITLAGKRDVLANHFLDQYTVSAMARHYRYFNLIGWKVAYPSRLNDDFRFNSDDTDAFSPTENLYLKLLYEKIAGNEAVGLVPALNSRLDDETGIMTLTMQSEYEDLTLGVLNNIYKQLSSFFISKTIEKQLKTYKIMKTKRDSVIGVLKSTEFALANFKDRNRNLVTVKGYLDELRLEREVGILNVMYAEVTKQLEATDFALKNKTPIVQVIDLPRRPIGATKSSWKRALIQGFLLGVVLMSLLVLGRRFIHDLMKEI
jgi:hypothetical protein